MIKNLLFFGLFFTAISCKKNTAPSALDWSRVGESIVFLAGKKVGNLQGNFVKELSGIAPSRRTPGAFWVHNDGKINEIYLIDSLGRHLATLPMPAGANFQDCEDIETGEIGGQSFIFLADIGDNNSVLKTHKLIKIAEPPLPIEPFPAPLDVPTSHEIFNFKYATGSKFDAECLLFDPPSGDFFVVTKAKVATIFLFPKNKQTAGTTAVLEKIGSMPIENASGGDISADGREILIKNKSEIFYWKKSISATLATFLVDSLPQSVPYKAEVQGEAVCFSLSARGFFTSTEKGTAAEQTIWFYSKR